MESSVLKIEDTQFFWLKNHLSKKVENSQLFKITVELQFSLSGSVLPQLKWVLTRLQSEMLEEINSAWLDHGTDLECKAILENILDTCVFSAREETTLGGIWEEDVTYVYTMRVETHPESRRMTITTSSAPVGRVAKYLLARIFELPASEENI